MNRLIEVSEKLSKTVSLILVSHILNFESNSELKYLSFFNTVKEMWVKHQESLEINFSKNQCFCAISKRYGSKIILPH